MMTIFWTVSTFSLSHVILLYMVSRVACDCPTPPVYEDKTHSNYDSSYSTDAQATYQCAPGYINPSGQTKSTCQRDGSWTQVELQCERGSCTNPGTPYKGTRSGDDFRVSKQVNFSCDEGYRLIGDTISTCMVDHTWSNSVPTCDAITCASLQAPQHASISPTGEARYNDLITIICNRGRMYSEQSNTRRCTENGWTGNEGTCIETDCGLPTLYNGRVKAPMGTGYGAKISYRCDDNTTREETQELTDSGGYSRCNDLGEWVPPPPTCKTNTCATLQAPKDGSIEPSGEARYNIDDVVTISCNRGKMYSEESKTRNCTENGWTGTAGTCIDIDCGLPTLYNGRVEALYGTGEGENITYRCDNGTTREESQALKNSDGYSRCFHTAKWAPSPPTCNIPCRGEVPDVTYGSIALNGSTSYPHNTKLNITCYIGYTHAGAEQVMCRNGTWTPSVDLTCELRQYIYRILLLGFVIIIMGSGCHFWTCGKKRNEVRRKAYLQETKCDALCLEVDRIIDTLPETYHQKTSRFVRSIFMKLITLIKSVVIIDKKGNENIVNEFLKNIDSLKDGDEDQDCRDMLNLIVDDLEWVIKEDCAEYMHGRNGAWQEKKRDIEDKCRADQNMSTDHIICDMQYSHGMERIHDALTQYVINYHPRGLIYDDPALTTCWERCCRLGLFPCCDNTATIKKKPEQTRREDIMLQPTNV